METNQWRNLPAIVLIVVLVVSAAGGAGTPNSVVSSVVGSAGAPASGSGIVVNGTAGQSTATGMATGNNIVLHAGFWAPQWESVSGVEVPDLEIFFTELQGNYPNPFNPQTRIEFTLADQCRVNLEVFDLKGRLVRTLVDETRASGCHHAIWDGTDLSGRRAASGTYFFRLQAGDYKSVMKMTMVK